MIAELFLTCALSLPSTNFTRPPITPWQASKDQEDKLAEWLRKHAEIDDVFITPKGQRDKLKESGWEQVPFTIDDKEIWIQRKQKNDKKKMQAVTLRSA